MLRTFLAMTLISFLPAFAAEAHQSGDACISDLTIPAGQSFKPTAIAQTRMPEKNGWSIQWHKNSKGEHELLAIHRTSLIVRRIRPTTGAILSEIKYLGGSRNEGPSVVHSSATGEIVVARAEANLLEIFPEQGGQPSGARTREPVKFLNVVSLKNGEVFAIAGGTSTIQIFKRSGLRLEEVAAMTSEAPIRQVFAAAGKSNDIEIALFNLDHKVKAYNYDADVEVLDKDIPAVVHLGGGKLSATTVDGRLMLLAAESRRDGSNLRVLSLGSGLKPQPSRTLELQTMVGEPAWGDKGSSLIVPLQEANKLVLRQVDASSGKTLGEDMAIGDGRMISDLSQFRMGNRRYYVFNKDGVLAYIQNENEVSVIAAPERSQIRQITPAVMLNDGTPVLGVLGYGPNGSVVNVVSLTGEKKTVVAPTATAE